MIKWTVVAMNSPDILVDVPIWPESGITDLSADPVQLSSPEAGRIMRAWKVARDRMRDSPELEQFSERLAREWAIETGQIEDVYDLSQGITVALIDHGFSVPIPEDEVNKDPEFVRQVLNDQREALEGLFAYVKKDQNLTKSYIHELHTLMTRSQRTVTGLDEASGQLLEVPMLHGQYKTLPNYPQRDGKRFLYAPPVQVESEMDRLLEMHLRHITVGVFPEVEAAWLHHRFTQIHPYQDGNGRIARALASLVLIRAGLFPFVVPRDEKSLYLRTLEQADQGNLGPLIKFIVRHQQRAYIKANDLAAKLSPDGNTPDEAAMLLAEALANRSNARSARIERRLAEVTSVVASAFEQTVRSTMGHLQKSHPGAEFSGWSWHEVRPSHPFALLVERQYGVKVGYIGKTGSSVLNFAPDVTLALYIYPLEDDLDESVQASFVLGPNGLDPVAIEIPFTATRDTTGAEVNAAGRQWAHDAVTFALNYLRKIV